MLLASFSERLSLAASAVLDMLLSIMRLRIRAHTPLIVFFAPRYAYSFLTASGTGARVSLDRCIWALKVNLTLLGRVVLQDQLLWSTREFSPRKSFTRLAIVTLLSPKAPRRM